MNKIKNLFINNMAAAVLVVSVLALFVPKTALWISTSWINYLLMVVMFGM